ncbi:MAG: hypothetical protein F4235_04645, partial [Candidatus Dadabacteria bacterium]|nr:hypothetical protein [Candidatus Dadabacteria bacterium]
MYYIKGDFDRAIEDSNKALELESPDALRTQTHLLRGYVYQLKGDFPKAFDDLVDSNKINPDLKSIFPRNYIAFQIDDIYKEGKEEDKAKAFEVYLKLLDSIVKIKEKQF